jgi:hypothetical protein
MIRVITEFFFVTELTFVNLFTYRVRDMYVKHLILICYGQCIWFHMEYIFYRQTYFFLFIMPVPLNSCIGIFWVTFKKATVNISHNWILNVIQGTLIEFLVLHDRDFWCFRTQMKAFICIGNDMLPYHVNEWHQFDISNYQDYSNCLSW